jgi:hypothetical protein
MFRASISIGGLIKPQTACIYNRQFAFFRRKKKLSPGISPTYQLKTGFYRGV